MRLIGLLFFLIIFTGSLEAQEKETAALAPLASMGDLDEIQKNIVYNSLQESLSKFYKLTSIKMYEKAEEEAFQQMDAIECTEAQCIALIQELLQVELFFIFPTRSNLPSTVFIFGIASRTSLILTLLFIEAMTAINTFFN